MLAHLKYTNLTSRAKAVFKPTQNSQLSARVALEIKHHIDHVLKHSRTCDRALFGDVSDDENADILALCKPHQLKCDLANLRDRAWRGGYVLAIKRLYRVYHKHLVVAFLHF